jgi:hypothetical protein
MQHTIKGKTEETTFTAKDHTNNLCSNSTVCLLLLASYSQMVEITDKVIPLVEIVLLYIPDT